MKKADAFALLNKAVTIVQSKFGVNKGANTLFYKWRLVDRVFYFYSVRVESVYKKTVVHSSHDWQKQNGYTTKAWVTISEKESVIFKGKGSDVLEFIKNFKVS